MLNIVGGHETNQMIERRARRHTITMGISLLDCTSDGIDKTCDNIYRKITTYAKDLISTGKAIERDYGIDRQQAHHRHPDLTGRCQLLPRRAEFRQDRPRA